MVYFLEIINQTTVISSGDTDANSAKYKMELNILCMYSGRMEDEVMLIVYNKIQLILHHNH